MPSRKRLLGIVGIAMVVGASCRSNDKAQGLDSARVAPAVGQIAPDTTGRRRILFVGTSLTAGLGLDQDSAFSYLIQRKIDSAGLPYETVNAGVSGETTAGLLQRLDWILKARYDVLVIESGANDGLRGVEPAAIQANLVEVIGRARSAHPDALVLLVRMEALPNYGRDYGASFHDVYTTVARETKVTLLPFLLDGVAGRAELNQGDGVHPNQTGERTVAENLWRGLEPIMRKRASK